MSMHGHGLVKAAAASESVSRVHIKNAGGWSSRFILVADHCPRKGHKKKIYSNHPGYGKSWQTREEISQADMDNFVMWLGRGLSTGGAVSRPLSSEPEALVLATRTSSRVDTMRRMSVCMAADHQPVEIEEEVVRCVQFLVAQVIHGAKLQADMGAIRKEKRVPYLRRGLAAVTGRRRARKLTQRRSKGYAYRAAVLQRAAAIRAEQNLEWLQIQKQRLATVIARQDLHALLPEGTSSIASQRAFACVVHLLCLSCARGVRR